MTHQPESQYTWSPLSERQAYEMAGIADVWDAAERGEPMPKLLRERIRLAEENLRPELERIAREAFAIPMSADGGLSLLVGS